MVGQGNSGSNEEKKTETDFSTYLRANSPIKGTQVRFYVSVDEMYSGIILIITVGLNTPFIAFTII
jgi:hypothetical protein